MSARRIARELAPLGLTLALVGLALLAPGPRLADEPTLVLLVDESSSIGARPAREAREALLSLGRQLPSDTRIVVSTFAAVPRRRAAGGAGDFERLLPAVDSRAEGRTDVGAALDHGLAHVLVDGAGSIVLATDGADTLGGGLAAAAAAGRLGVPVDVLLLSPSSDAAVALEDLIVPHAVSAGELVDAIVTVRTNAPRRVDVRLELDDRPVATASGSLDRAGLHAFRLVVPGVRRSGTLVAYVGTDEDGETSDNIARAPLRVAGKSRFARVGAGRRGGAAGDALALLPPESELGRYDAIHVGLDDGYSLSTDDERRLAEYVRRGGGLALSCARPADAAALRGGPLEALLPVHLEPPASRADDAAIVLLVDRSGSMESEGPNRHALDLAVESARSIARLLDDDDRLGLIAFDVAPHVVQPLRPLADVREAARALTGLRAGGGTDWGPALDLAVSWLGEDPAPRRQIVLVSDGRLAEGRTGESTIPWPDGVTLSTISVGPGADRGVLRELARSRRGEHRHVERVEELPAALRRQVARLRLAPTIPGPFTARPTAPYAAALAPLALADGASGLRVRARRGTDVVMASGDGDPLVVRAGAGWGRTVFIALDPRLVETSAGRAGDAERLVDAALSLAATRRAATPVHRAWSHFGGGVVDVVHDAPGSALPGISVRRPDGEIAAVETSWVAAGRARARFALGRAGEHVIRVGERSRRAWLAGSSEAAARLSDPLWPARLADASGGRVLDARNGIPHLTAPRRSLRWRRDAVPWLAAAAAFVFFAHCCTRITASPASAAAFAPPAREERRDHAHTRM